MIDQGLIEVLLRGILLMGWSPPEDNPRPLKLIILVILGALWVYGVLGDILTSIVSNFQFGKRSVARDMTISGFHFLANVTNNIFSY